MPEGVDNFIGAVGDVIKAAPTFYEDAIQPAVQETGKILALIPQTVEAALLPLRKWNIERGYKFVETKKLLEHKLENVDPEKIVTPESYVAVPAIQAISYSMNSDELRNLYANLLAKAMNSDTKDMVHPSFVEIIKQMSPIDALVFKTIMERDANPIINLLYAKFDDSDFPIPIASRIIATNITDLNMSSVESIALSIDNLIKQGLITIPNDESYTNERFYNSILSSTYYIKQKELHPKTNDGFIFYPDKKMINKSNLGNTFYNVCLLDF